jgi:hypothetical protein
VKAVIYELWVIVIVAAVAANRGKWSFSHPNFKRPVLLVLPLILQITAMLMNEWLLVPSSLFLVMVGGSYALLMAGLWFNRQIPGFSLFLIGTLANALVIWLNGGRMPVSLDALHTLQLQDYIPLLIEGTTKHTVLDDQTVLPFLGDIIPLARPIGDQAVISIGDILQSLGIARFLWRSISYQTIPGCGKQMGKGGEVYEKAIN